MANVILSEQQCAQAERIADEILGYKAKIESCIATFDYAIKNPDIAAWVNETAIGQETLQKVINNNANLRELANEILAIYQSTCTLVNDSRRINNGN